MTIATFSVYLEYSLLQIYVLKKKLPAQQRLEMLSQLDKSLREIILYSALTLPKKATVQEKMDRLEDFSYLSAFAGILLAAFFLSIGCILFIRYALQLFDKGHFIDLLVWIFWMVIAILNIIYSISFWWQLSKIYDTVIKGAHNGNG